MTYQGVEVIKEGEKITLVFKFSHANISITPTKQQLLELIHKITEKLDLQASKKSA